MTFRTFSIEEPTPSSFFWTSSSTCFVWALMSPSKWAPTPAMKTRPPYEVTPLKSGVFSGFLPSFQCTFFTGLLPSSWARAVFAATVAPSAAEAPARNALRFVFAIVTSCCMRPSVASPVVR